MATLVKTDTFRVVVVVVVMVSLVGWTRAIELLLNPIWKSLWKSPLESLLHYKYKSRLVILLLLLLRGFLRLGLAPIKLGIYLS